MQAASVLKQNPVKLQTVIATDDVHGKACLHVNPSVAGCSVQKTAPLRKSAPYKKYRPVLISIPVAVEPVCGYTIAESK